MAEYIRQPPLPKFSVLIASPKGVAERWEAQYPKDRWPDKNKIGENLIALPPSATADDVAKVIGNKSWTHPHCFSCGEYREIAVEFDNGDTGTTVCGDCLKAALTALTSGKCRSG